MLSGGAPDREAADFLAALADRGETDGELLAMLDAMMGFADRVDLRTGRTAIDMCGTGGDGQQTFNVSTAASFVVAAAGGAVAKHGNRSSSGISGSADVLEYLGCDLGRGPGEAAAALERHGICFMFAQRFHPAMRHVAGARRLLRGRRTAFNLLGPMANPAGVKRQLVGVSSADLLSRMPSLLRRRGAEAVMAVRSEGGMDELSTSSANRAVTMVGGSVSAESFRPEDVGLHRSSPADIRIRTMEEAARSFVGALDGTAGRAAVETTALNAAGGLVVAGVADGIGEAVGVALEAISDGRAIKTLRGFVGDAGDPSRLAEIAGE